jgi:hypothetical protein
LPTLQNAQTVEEKPMMIEIDKPYADLVDKYQQIRALEDTQTESAFKAAANHLIQMGWMLSQLPKEERDAVIARAREVMETPI